MSSCASVFLAPLIAIGSLSGCNTGAPRPMKAPRAISARSPIASTLFLPESLETDPAKYAGSAACIACHNPEAGEWLLSRHSQTMRIPDPTSPGPLSPPVGKIAGTDIDVAADRTTNHLSVRPVGGSQESYPLTLALGSGKSGITYIEVNGDQVLEFRKSFFVPQHRWYTTPGIEAIPSFAFFSGHTPQTSRRCILCHSVTTGRSGLVPEQRFFGVGCESCHGPGKAHSEAARSGQPGKAKMESLSTLSATQVNELCGRCHRTTRGLDLAGPDSAATNRFQPYGLMLSRCFLESGRSLSCVTCHDPHSNTNTDSRVYEKACLSCHSGVASSHSGSDSASSTLTPLSKTSFSPTGGLSRNPHGKICPVNPKTGCISCHMPSRTAFPNTTLPITMADHWIRVYKRHSP